MDIAVLSIAMSQTKAQESLGIAVMKMAMDDGNVNAAKMTDMMKNFAADPNLGNMLDVYA